MRAKRSLHAAGLLSAFVLCISVVLPAGANEVPDRGGQTPACPAAGVLRAHQLPERVDAVRCGLVGRTVRDFGAKVTVPAPGFGRSAHLLTTAGSQEFGIETSSSGVATFRSTGREDGSTDVQTEPLATSTPQQSQTAMLGGAYTPGPTKGNATLIDRLELPYRSPYFQTEVAADTNEQSCGADSNALWYKFETNFLMRLRASVVSVDPALDVVLGVHKGTNTPRCADAAGLGGDERLQFDASGNKNYFFQISSRSGGPASVRFLLEAVPPSNDDFADAKRARSLPFKDVVHAAGATLQSEEPKGACSASPVSSVWYRVKLASTKVLTATVGSPDVAQTELAVFTGSRLSNLTKIGCASFEDLTMKAVGGRNYYFQVRSTNPYGNRVSFGLKETSMEPCPGCTPPCKADQFNLSGHKVKNQLGWSFSTRGIPNELTKKEAKGAISRAFQTITGSKNDCGLNDRVTVGAPYRGTTQKRPPGFTCGKNDGANVVGFGPLGGWAEDYGWYTIGYACQTWMTNYSGFDPVIEADITLNQGAPWATLPRFPLSCKNRFDVEEIAVHEAGHVFGLDHVGPTNLTMYAQADLCSVARRSLGKGDVMGLRRLY